MKSIFQNILLLISGFILLVTPPPGAREFRSDGVRWGIPLSHWLSGTRAQLRGKTRVSVSDRGVLELATLAVTLGNGSDRIIRPHEPTFLSEEAVIIFCRATPVEPCVFSREFTTGTINPGVGEK